MTEVYVYDPDRPNTSAVKRERGDFRWSYELAAPIPSKIESDGGPSNYYDFQPHWVTWNDLADDRSVSQWKEHSFHLGNIGKALMRWGNKGGTTKEYDARKIIYSALRVLQMLKGKDEVRRYLQSLLDDPQFK
jgi:hypothetical protein